MHLKFYIYELQIRIYELHCFARADSSEALWSTALHKCRSWSELNRSQHTWKSFIIPIVTILYRWDLNIHKLSNCIPRVCASNNDNHESWQSKNNKSPRCWSSFTRQNDDNDDMMLTMQRLYGRVSSSRARWEDVGGTEARLSKPLKE
jgi:hypothetical protein